MELVALPFWALGPRGDVDFPEDRHGTALAIFVPFMSHPYREPPSGSALGEGAAITACWRCERRAALATMRLRPLGEVVAISLALVGVFLIVVGLSFLQTATRLTLAVERLDGVVATMNVVPARPAPPPVCLPSTTATPATPATATGDGPVVGIVKLARTAFRVDRRVIDALLEGQVDLGRTCGIVPESKNGRVVGVRLFGVRPDSLPGRLGIENGDLLQSVNGIDISSPEKALQAYARIRTSKAVSVVVSRRGSRMLLEYYVV